MSLLVPFSHTLSDGRVVNGQMLRATSSQTTTLLLHGWLDNSGSFTNLMPLLPTSAFGTLIALDLPGHGTSAHLSPDAYYTTASAAVDVCEIVTSFLSPSSVSAPPPSVNLIGHSMGTGIGLLCCSVLRGKIGKFVMLDGLGPFTLVPGTDESSQLLRDILERRLKKGRGVGGGVKGFASIEEAAARRAEQNIAGKMTTEEALLLAARGLSRNPQNDTYSWSSDPKLTWPSAMRYGESAVLEMCRSADADILIVLGRQGIFKQLLNLGVAGARLDVWAFSVLVGLWLWIAAFFMTGKTRAAMRMGANMGARVRALRGRVVLVEGGHHVHLIGQGAATVGKVIRE